MSGSKTISRIGVLGDGGWGTTLAIYLARKGYDVTLWGPFPDYIRKVARNRYNAKFLPGVYLPETITVTADLGQALRDQDLTVLAIPSKYVQSVLDRVRAAGIMLEQRLFLSVTKGIDTERLLRVSQMVEQTLPEVVFAVLSGPTIALEVAKGVPSSAVVGARKATIAKKIQEVFNSVTFRIYTNTDIVGIELGGSMKNVIALACGMCDGLGFGTNTKSALLTRGLAEMTRMGKCLGARSKTFFGLTGVGDLVTTCFSPRSRNRTVGQKLGEGRSLKAIIAQMEMVAEGVETAKAAYKIGQQYDISMPITTEVYKILYHNKSPRKAVTDLMTRDMKTE